MSVEEFSVEFCAAPDRADALRLLHSGLSPDQQTALPTVLNAVHAMGETEYPGLLVARNSETLLGTVWVQLAPGSSAIVWPPAIGGVASAELMRAAAKFLDDKRVSLAQVLVSPDAPQDPQLLAAGEFHRLVELRYLKVERDLLPEKLSVNKLNFISAACDEPERLGRLIMKTYEQTLDCPQLNGLRDAADILKGYQAQGEFSADRWFFVQQDDNDVGVLILTIHPDRGTWELVYMGVVPESRGKRFGEEIVKFAISQASAGGASRLVLAVDQSNAPALDMYRAAGFVGWDSRIVYARLKKQDSARS